MLARIRKSMEEKDRGFTLIELLVVMIIIGILAAIAIPVFLNQRKKAVDTAIKSDLRSVAAEVETYYVDNQAYPTATSYTAAGTGGATSLTDSTVTTGTIATSARVTKGDIIQYKAVTGGYCLTGQSANSDANDSTHYYVYSSTTGGLVSGAATALASPCA